MSDVSEKLAAAGFAPVDGMTHFHRCDNGWMMAEVRRCCVIWDKDGKCRSEKNCDDLVPLPAPQAERLSDERLSDHRISQIINYESGDAKTASNARIFDERWELANEASAMRSGVTKMAVRESELTRELAELREQNKHLGESVQELTTAVCDWEHKHAELHRWWQQETNRAAEATKELAKLREQVATLTKERYEAIAECGRTQRNLESSKNAIELVQRDRDTLTKERDAARELCRRFRGLFHDQVYDSRYHGEWVAVCRDYDATYTDTPAPAPEPPHEGVGMPREDWHPEDDQIYHEPDTTQSVIDAATACINAGNEIPGGMLELWRSLRDAVRAYESEVPS